MPAACMAGVGSFSAIATMITPAIQTTNIALKIAQPWRRLPTMRP